LVKPVRKPLDLGRISPITAYREETNIPRPRPAVKNEPRNIKYELEYPADKSPIEIRDSPAVEVIPLPKRSEIYPEIAKVIAVPRNKDEKKAPL